MASSTTKINLRSQQHNIYLIEYVIPQLLGSKLPSKKEVLGVFFFHTRTLKLEVRKSTTMAANEVLLFWNKARIPTRDKSSVIKQIEKLYQKWRKLNKSSTRGGTSHKVKEDKFVEELDDLFDIAHVNALTTIKIEEDKKFLLAQRKKGRPGSMIGIDMALVGIEKRKLEREEADERRLRATTKINTLAMGTVQFTSSTESSDNVGAGGMELEVDALPSASEVVKRGTQLFINERIVSALDKCMISDRNAMHLMAAVAEGLGHNVSNLVLNRSSIRRYRTANRQKIADFVKENLHLKATAFFVVHWDGKILEDITGMNKIDRLPVIVTNGEIEQILGVPKLDCGKGKNIAAAVYQLLVEWNLSKRVQAMSFDTTSSNTGEFAGAAVLLEQLLERDLMHLPCRHHIYELVLRAVFEEKIGKTFAPDVSLFRRFQQNWEKINQNAFETGVSDEIVASKLITAPDDIITFCMVQLQKRQRRNDYKELLELVVLFLGGDFGEYKFKELIPIHHARWMSKAIYSLKIFMFRDQFKLAKSQLDGIRDVCVFIVRLYVKVWYRCTEAVKAPNQDFNFLKALHSYADLDKNLSKVMVTKFIRHLWYLAEEAIALAYFDSDVSCDIKRKMLAIMCIYDGKEILEEKDKEVQLEKDEETDEETGEEDDDWDEDDEGPIRSMKKIAVNFAEVTEQFLSNDLSAFVTVKTINFFLRFNLPHEFIRYPPETWPQREDYQQALKFFEKIHVVNDTAERGVKMMEDYNKILCRNEEEKQYLIQVVGDYRKKYPSFEKRNLI